MDTLKDHGLSIAGLIALLIFVFVSYQQDTVHLNKILVCSVILGEVLLLKIFGSFKRVEHSTVKSSEKDH